MTNFQDLVAKEKSLVALVPVLGAISCPAHSRWYDDSQEMVMETLLHVHVHFHIFTVIYSSFYRFISNQHNDQLPGITVVIGSNPIQA